MYAIRHTSILDSFCGIMPAGKTYFWTIVGVVLTLRFELYF